MRANLKAEIILRFGLEDHVFALKCKEIEELEYQCDKKPFNVIFQNITNRQWQINDLKTVIRLGLIGGGTPLIKATKLTEQYCCPPFLEKVVLNKLLLPLSRQHTLALKILPINQSKKRAKNKHEWISAPVAHCS